MGYESRIFIINRRTKYKGFEFDECLAMFNLSCVDQELLNVLRTRKYNSPSKCYGNEVPTDLHIGTGMEIIKEDPYGNVPTECNVMDFYMQLLESASKDNYRRYEMVIGFLTPLIHNDQWDEIIVVHTGY